MIPLEILETIVFGNKGNDTIEGGVGADLINAGRGNGYIKDAGIGADVITHDQGTSVVVQTRVLTPPRLQQRVLMDMLSRLLRTHYKC